MVTELPITTPSETLCYFCLRQCVSAMHNPQIQTYTDGDFGWVDVQPGWDGVELINRMKRNGDGGAVRVKPGDAPPSSWGVLGWYAVTFVKGYAVCFDHMEVAAK